MKTLGRILIILFAAAVVIGGAYALLQTSAAQALVGQPMGQGKLAGQAEPPDFANGQNAQPGEIRGGPGGDRVEREGGGGSWETVGRNLLEIVVIVATVQVVWSIKRWLRRKSSPTQIVAGR
jgi:hypothetical protein